MTGSAGVVRSQGYSISPENRTALRRVTLRGAPFKNPTTVKELIIKCVPRLSPDEANNVVEKAIAEPDKETTVIVCLEKDAQVYCRNLVENGLESEIS
jgi:hypothetical protein